MCRSTYNICKSSLNFQPIRFHLKVASLATHCHPGRESVRIYIYFHLLREKPVWLAHCASRRMGSESRSRSASARRHRRSAPARRRCDQIGQIRLSIDCLKQVSIHDLELYLCLSNQIKSKKSPERGPRDSYLIFLVLSLQTRSCLCIRVTFLASRRKGRQCS